MTPRELGQRWPGGEQWVLQGTTWPRSTPRTTSCEGNGCFATKSSVTPPAPARRTEPPTALAGMADPLRNYVTNNTSSAILRGCVEMTSRPNVPVICPPASSVVRSAASHPPGPLGRVPRPHRYYQPTPISRLPSRLASFPSLGTTTASPLFAPPGRDDSPRSWTTSTAAPAPPLIGGENETSQVPGQPLRTCSALRPRRTTDPRPLQRR